MELNSRVGEIEQTGIHRGSKTRKAYRGQSGTLVQV